MKSFVVGHAVFLVGALGLAFVASERKAERGGDAEFVLFDVQPAALSRIEYAWPNGTATVDVGGSEKARALAVHVARTIEKKASAKDAAAPDGGPEGAADEPARTEESRFQGGRMVERAAEQVAPLKARRSLGEVDAERLKIMGLEAPERTLTVKAGDRSITLEIGESTYGGQGRYARVKGERRVVLLESSIVSGLEGGPMQLMERRVVAAAPEDVVSATLKSGDRVGRFVQVDREQPQKRRFARADDPTAESEEANAFVSTLRGLRVVKYVQADELPATTEAGAFALELTEGRKLDGVVLEKADGSGHLVRVGPWTMELSTAQGKELVEDLAAALPAE